MIHELYNLIVGNDWTELFRFCFVGILADIALGLAGGYGSKPSVAMFNPLDLTEEQKKSIAGNISNFDDISQLGDLYRQYVNAQQEAEFPGFTATRQGLLSSQASGAKRLLDVGNQFLGGEIPADAKAAIERNSAYKSFFGGYGGSQMARGLTARDLGLTSLDLIGRGANMIGQGGNSAQQWSSMSKANILDPSNFLVTPQQQSSFDLTNAILQQQSQQMKFNVDAAPDPMLAGVSNSLQNTLGMIASIYSGGLFGGSKGGGGGSGGGGFGFGG